MPVAVSYTHLDVYKRQAQRLGVREGFVPVLIQADDETLLECLVMNADPEHDADFYEFDLKTVTEYRKKMLSAPVKDGKAVLEELTGQRKEEAEDDDLDWEEEVLGEMEGGYDNDRFSCYWDDDTEMTYPLILAKIPVKNPWEIFAYLPFGNWNECPDKSIYTEEFLNKYFSMTKRGQNYDVYYKYITNGDGKLVNAE